MGVKYRLTVQVNRLQNLITAQIRINYQLTHILLLTMVTG